MENSTDNISTLRELHIRYGKLVKPFDKDSTDQYLQCVADVGVSSVQIALFSGPYSEIFLDDVKVQIGDWVDIELKAEGYGYVTKKLKNFW